MNKFFARLIPFIMAGIAIVAFAFGLILLAYLLVFGAIVGLALFAISWVRTKFFSSKSIVKKEQKHVGRTIDHKD